MANFSAADVKKLRDATGAGMMDCKKALEEADGDFDKAVEILRVKGEAKNVKRGDRGRVQRPRRRRRGRDDRTRLRDRLRREERAVPDARRRHRHALRQLECHRRRLAQDRDAQGRQDRRARAVQNLAAVIGEKLELRRAVKLDGQVATYLHRKASDLPPQVGVLVEFTGGDAEAARGAAMQVAAMRAALPHPRRGPGRCRSRPSGASPRRRRAPRASPRRRCRRSSRVASTASSRPSSCSSRSRCRRQKKSVKQVLDEAGVTVTKFAHFEVGQA